MNIQFTDSFRKRAQKLTQKDDGLSFIFKKQFNLFKSNPRHPSLHLHKLQGKRSEQLAIKIKPNLRALAVKSNKIKDTFIFFDLVTHDEY